MCREGKEIEGKQNFIELMRKSLQKTFVTGFQIPIINFYELHLNFFPIIRI